MGQPMYICQQCKKAPATIHLTDIHNNVKKELHLCESCAMEKGFNLKGAANLPHLLGMAAKKQASQAAAKAQKPEDDPVCPKCGMRWSQFGERGRLGCPEDYQAFGPKLRQLVATQMAGHAKSEGGLHTGKVPGAKRKEDKLDTAIRTLEKRLRRAVAEENYEVAATLKQELDRLRQEKRAGVATGSGDEQG